MKTRIETNEMGELYIALPDDIVEELMLEEGEPVELEESEGTVILYFG